MMFILLPKATNMEVLASTKEDFLQEETNSKIQLAKSKTQPFVQPAEPLERIYVLVPQPRLILN